MIWSFFTHLVAVWFGAGVGVFTAALFCWHDEQS